MPALHIKFEELRYDGRTIGIDREHLLEPVVQVADRSAGGVDPLTRLLGHALLDLLAQVVEVVLGHQDLDAVHELLVRVGLVGEDDVFLEEVDDEPEVVERHVVLEVAVQAIGLLDHDRPDPRILLQEGDHLIELLAACPFRGLDVDELRDGREAHLRTVVLGDALLGGDGEAALLLLLARDAHVDDGPGRGLPHSLALAF
ncbi:hypothetical protein D3C87_1400200 [compost metagenome]